MLKVGNFGQRDVRELPHREARAVPLGSRAGARGLQHLPRPARLEQRAHAGGEAADAVPAVPHRHAASLDDLRRRASWRRGATGSSAAAASTATPRFTGRTARPATRSSGEAMPMRLRRSLALVTLPPGAGRALRAGAAAPPPPASRSRRRRFANYRRVHGSRHRVRATDRTKRASSGIATFATAARSMSCGCTKASTRSWFNVQADHVGYRDQRFYGGLQPLRQA